MLHVNQCCYEELFHRKLEPLTDESVDYSGGNITIKRYKETDIRLCNVCNEEDDSDKQYVRAFVKYYLSETPCHINCIAHFGGTTNNGMGVGSGKIKISCRAVKFLLHHDNKIQYLKDYDLKVFQCVCCEGNFIDDILFDGDRCREHRTYCQHCHGLYEQQYKEMLECSDYAREQYQVAPNEADLPLAEKLGNSSQAEKMKPATININNKE